MKLNSILNDKGCVEMKENLSHCFKRHSDLTLVECFRFSVLYYTLREILRMLGIACVHNFKHIKLKTKSNYIFPVFTVVLFFIIPLDWNKVQTL